MLSTKLLKLTKSFEGCKLAAYQDQGGVWTVGWGCTGPSIKKGTTWTQAQADKELESRLIQTQKDVTVLLKVKVNQNQIDALTDFAYNLGVHALSGSTLLKLINDNHHNVFEISDEFLVWDHVHGVVIPGLLRRRIAERNLFVEEPSLT